MTAKEYNRINEQLAEYSAISALLESVEAGIKHAQVDAAKALLPEHAELKTRLTNIEAELRKFSDAHYVELFPSEDKRNHKTPFGELKYHKSSSLEFDDIEKVLLKIRAACAKELERAQGDSTPPRFMARQLIRTHEEPDLEALDKFDDVTLALFGVRRERKDNFKIVPFAMKSDKPAKKAVAVKEAA